MLIRDNEFLIMLFLDLLAIANEFKPHLNIFFFEINNDNNNNNYAQMCMPHSTKINGY